MPAPRPVPPWRIAPPDFQGFPQVSQICELSLISGGISGFAAVGAPFLAANVIQAVSRNRYFLKDNAV
jgi:hypothetical protein